jgi:hypothetical protein
MRERFRTAWIVAGPFLLVTVAAIAIATLPFVTALLVIVGCFTLAGYALPTKP